jgi:hypothetical protein
VGGGVVQNVSVVLVIGLIVVEVEDILLLVALTSNGFAVDIANGVSMGHPESIAGKAVAR